MPRSTPAAETEQLACWRSNEWPVATRNGSPWKDSRKTPRGSPCCRGVISHAPGTDSSRYVMTVPSVVGGGGQTSGAGGRSEVASSHVVRSSSSNPSRYVPYPDL